MRITAVVLLIAVLTGTLAACGGIKEQDTETILNSELLKFHEIEITRPENPYYNFFNGEIKVEIALHVQGEHGSYYFAQGGWNDELIKELVLISEEGIAFAKEWLGIEIEEPVDFIFNVIKPEADNLLNLWGGGGILGTAVYINIPAKDMPALIIHEAVHAVLRIDSRLSNFPTPPETSSMAHALFLEEGLCSVIDYLYFLQTEYNYDHNRYGRIKNTETYLHDQARWSLRHNKNFENEAEFGTKYPQLMSYETAASFIYFLIEYKGTKEDFMLVFDDIYLFEEIYGVDTDSMIKEWLNYLL